MIADHEPRSGSLVHTLGGLPVGVVGAVRSDAFEVREARRRYWLRKEAVYLADEAITTLVCETRGIEAYRAV